MQKNELDTDLIPSTETNSKWIIDLKVKCKIIKLLEDKVGENLDDFKYGNDFSDKTKIRSMKKLINKLEFIKIKNFCSAKDSINKMRKQATDWEKILGKETLIKNCYSKYKNS